MSIRNTSSPFKAAPPPARNKADQITETVRLMTAAETQARNIKTARLRELRLARELAEKAEKKELAAAPKRNTRTKKTA